MAQSATKILVVDDDQDVLTVASAALEADGYTVLSARNGVEALEILASTRDIDLLFTDIVMPSMDGFDLAERAKQLRPGLRVLYTSGYLRDEGVWHGSLITKPWRPDDLQTAIKNALT